jgi:hypothetical protein
VKLDADKLRTDGLRLELPARDGETHRLELGPSGGVTGTYEHTAERIGLRSIRGEEMELTELVWHLSQGRVSAPSGLKLTEVFIDAEIARGEIKRRSRFVGTIRAGRAWAPSLRLQLGAPVELGEVQIEGLRLDVHGDGTLELQTESVQTSQAHLERDPFELTFSGLALPSGLEYRDNNLALPLIKAANVDFNVRLDGGEGQTATTSAQTTPKSKGKGSQRKPLDLRLLDGLNGHVNVDLAVDATVPIIRRRQATHRFRIPIQGGTLNYRRLERDLSTLEDAFLDFRVKEGNLILEKNIPMVPWDNKTLVYWELPEKDRTLAEQRVVRLSTLTRPIVPSARKEEEVEQGKKGIVLRKLGFENVSVDLGLDGPSTLSLPSGGIVHLGSAEDPALGRIQVRGDLVYVPDTETAATQLAVEAERIHGGVEELPLGGYRLNVDSVGLRAAEQVTVVFSGVRPQSVKGRLRDLRIGHGHLRPRR